jgi:hypothetical protein
MLGSAKRPIARRLVSGVLAAGVLGAITGVALDADAGSPPRASVQLAAASAPATGTGTGTSSVGPGPASSACGPASAATIASVDEIVARGIYAGEISGSEVSADVAHVTGSQALLSALAGNNAAAVYAAVHTIVYTPHWHIVRLRVLAGGRVLADVGGPDVTAPVSGTLRSHGRKLGTYVMSVQDDAGYVKLVSRFIGVPIDLYRNDAYLMGTLAPAPSKVSAGSSVNVHGASYRVALLTAGAFPSGTLGVALFVATPSSAVSATSCASVTLGAWGSVAMHVAARLQPLSSHYAALVRVLHDVSGGLAYVISGSRRIAGGAGPARIPRSGTVQFHGRSWSVFSWEPSPPARVYFLTPAG